MNGQDGFSQYDDLLSEADITSSPWKNGEFVPDWDLFRDLLTIPVEGGQAAIQQSGAAAKALDAWVAHELRRAGFPPDAVWPRVRRPRVLPAEVAELEAAIEQVQGELDKAEQSSGEALKPGSLRRAIKRLPKALPGSAAANVLGRFYVKQVDVVVSSWKQGPDVLISGKTMFSAYSKNRANRYEEALGEAPNLRDRYPLSAMGFAFLVRSNIYKEEGAYVMLRDLLLRLRAPSGPFNATMLLVADWTDELVFGDIKEPAEDLSAGRFFGDLVETVISNTPANTHKELRERRDGQPPGGSPEVEADLAG